MYMPYIYNVIKLISVKFQYRLSKETGLKNGGFKKDILVFFCGGLKGFNSFPGFFMFFINFPGTDG